ncbi:MAG: DUF3800 domain-containing protein [Candidatus Caenarcaniphilales bacterium]|nr:DUF3800 domain-containing protein [Candidatus Caenarcaniphilales bacterium]
MSKSNQLNPEAHFFVDETGDLTRFNKRGKSMLGSNGVSDSFILGAARFPESPESHREDFDKIRQEILSNPFFQDLRSVKRSTSKVFHANEDHPVVRNEVFKLIQKINFKVFAIVRRKSKLIDESKARFEYTGNKLTEAEIYSSMTSRLFKELLHKNAKNNIVFAARGKTFSNDSLDVALNKAMRNCFNSHGIKNESENQITKGELDDYIGLQIVDYCLWTLSRLYERKEEQFFELVRNKFSLIQDMDDTRKADYGVYYTKGNPIYLNKIL